MLLRVWEDISRGGGIIFSEGCQGMLKDLTCAPLGRVPKAKDDAIADLARSPMPIAGSATPAIPEDVDFEDMCPAAA